jgi:hypothetical protein
MLDWRVSNVDSRPTTNPAVHKVTHVAPTTANKVIYGGWLSLHYFLFLRMIESFINVRGLPEKRRNLSWPSAKYLNFTVCRARELYKRGVNKISWFSVPDLL